MIALAVLLSGFVSGLLLAQSSGIDLTGGGSIGGLLLSSGVGVLAIAVIAATLLALFVRGRTALAAVSITAVVAAGISAVLVPAAVFEYIAVISGASCWAVVQRWLATHAAASRKVLGCNLL